MTIQRIRDPLYNMIEFHSEENNDLDDVLWKLLQTEPMQRLRRIRQLGFAEYVYPGATHSRFAHSIGVMHTAKKIRLVIEKQLSPGQKRHDRADVAIFAAMLHDIGHGPFSHAFENAFKNTQDDFDHEKFTETILKENKELKDTLDQYRPNLHEEIIDMLTVEDSIYASIISSQFDADRLDYMQRDRMMTGTQHGAIDFQWLVANLQVASSPPDNTSQTIPNVLVLDHKAIYAAETYLLGLLHLYQTVYFHKTIRGAEALFTQMLKQIFKHADDNTDIEKNTGLPESHPLILFIKNPTVENLMLLDDTVILGALPLMRHAKNSAIEQISQRFLKRKLFKCIDLNIMESFDNYNQTPKDTICSQINEFNQNANMPHVLFDTDKRELYKNVDKTKPHQHIYCKTSQGIITNLEKHSAIVKTIKPFHFARLYYDADDEDAQRFCQDLKDNLLKKNKS